MAIWNKKSKEIKMLKKLITRLTAALIFKDGIIRSIKDENKDLKTEIGRLKGGVSINRDDNKTIIVGGAIHKDKLKHILHSDNPEFIDGILDMLKEMKQVKPECETCGKTRY